MFRSYLGIVFGLKRRTFMCFFSWKGRYLTSKIKIFGTHSRSSPLGSRGCPTHKKNPKDFDSPKESSLELTIARCKNMQKSGNKGSGSFYKFREFSGSFDIFLEFLRSLRESSACFVFGSKKAATSQLAPAPYPKTQ